MMPADVYCYKCKVKMQRDRNGLKIKLPNDYCQHGDLFKCPVCGIKVVSDLGKAHPDRNPDTFAFELEKYDSEKNKRLREWALRQ